MSQGPDFAVEDELRLQGYELVAGVDEVGRGALAGPVVAAAVILPHPAGQPWFELVRDSKQLSARRRESLFDLINDEALAVGVGIISNQVIDSVNILQATRLAMMRAVDGLLRRPAFLLVDRLGLSQCPIPQRGITGGDRTCLSIACASIVAKVTRDRMMVKMDSDYPGYGFARHKGYGTATHLSSLLSLGPSPVHRRYFAPVRDAIRRRDRVSPSCAHSMRPAGRSQEAGRRDDSCDDKCPG